MVSDWQTSVTPGDPDSVVPDGSEIRRLVQTARASMVHCTLRPGEVSKPVRHHTVDELWYFVGGFGQLSRRQGLRDQVVEVRPGTAVSIPVGTEFQFRTDGDEPLTFVIVTVPPWPGEHEAEPATGPWVPTGGR
jgi:mannose-6-phosphate isomerase-like protein (cupin superfamily)